VGWRRNEFDASVVSIRGLLVSKRATVWEIDAPWVKARQKQLDGGEEGGVSSSGNGDD
jgi:hypothetical protein